MNNGKRFEVESMAPGLDDVSVNKEVVSKLGPEVIAPEAVTLPTSAPVATTSEAAPIANVVEEEKPRGSRRLAAEQAAGRATLIRKFGFEDTSLDDNSEPAADGRAGKRKRR